jgi:hypothetical protein
MSNIGNLYLPLQTISIPKENHARLIFTYQDEKGQLLDLTGVQDIIFAVWDSYGGTLQFQKSLSNGDILLHGNDYEFSFYIDDTDTITTRLGYHECEVTNSEGRRRTVSAGLYRAENTFIGSIS